MSHLGDESEAIPQGLEANERFSGFLKLLESQIEMTEGTNIGWFGIINPGEVDSSEIINKLVGAARTAGRDSVIFEYPQVQEGKTLRPWRELIEATSGQNAPIILLTPEQVDYSDDQAKIDHLYYGMQAYGLNARNKISTTGQGIIIIAPQHLNAHDFNLGYRTCIDLASYMSLYEDLAFHTEN